MRIDDGGVEPMDKSNVREKQLWKEVGIDGLIYADPSLQ